MVPRDQRHHINFLRLEPSKPTVANEVFRVPMVIFVADMDADVV